MSLPWETEEGFEIEEQSFEEAEAELEELKAKEEIDATEAAITLAEEHGIDLSNVIGSGLTGRIVKNDVEELVAESEAPEETEEGEAVEEELDAEGAPVIPDLDPIFPDGTRIIDEEQVEVLLNNAASRYRQIAPRVAYLGQGRQKYFSLYLASWQVRPGGIFYVPEQLADYEQLQEGWTRLGEEAAPEGFVAFRAT